MKMSTKRLIEIIKEEVSSDIEKENNMKNLTEAKVIKDHRKFGVTVSGDTIMLRAGEHYNLNLNASQAYMLAAALGKAADIVAAGEGEGR